MDTVPILIIMVPLLLPCMSERENFPLSYLNTTWDEAREHCKECYKELVTVSFDNSLALVQGVMVEKKHWVGLREKLAEYPWSSWANGDPLTFQNWYPAKWQSVAGTTTTTAAATTTTTTITTTPNEDQTSTNGSVQTTNYDTPETTLSYQSIDNDKEACVAMLSFGPWVKVECSETLPYICYDDRFYGKASVDTTTTNATMHWSAAPGNISSYRVTVRQGEVNFTYSTNNLTYDLFNLTPGTLYTVRVFPVKCDRDLNSQNVSFFTKPETVQNLTVGNITESSVVLSWDHPVGNLESYHVEVQDGRCNTVLKEETKVTHLIPGGLYTLSVFSAVANGSVRSDPASRTMFTKPRTVSNVTVSDVTNHSLVLSWTHTGNATGYRVVIKGLEPPKIENVNHTTRRLLVTELTAGTKLSLTVHTLASGRNEELVADGFTRRSFTKPNSIPSLFLEPTANSIKANWSLPLGAYQLFHVSVHLNGSTIDRQNTTVTNMTLYGLSTAAEYKVTVTTVAGDFFSEPIYEHKYTLPVMPDITGISFNGKTATMTWTVPNIATTTQFLVTYNSSFWNHNVHKEVTDGKQTVTMDDLKPGTCYEFRVYTKSGDLKSEPAYKEKCTEGDESNITLSMVCSSPIPLHCEKNATKDEALAKLKEHFDRKLDGVLWKITWIHL